jgi:hypothetical protein
MRARALLTASSVIAVFALAACSSNDKTPGTAAAPTTTTVEVSSSTTAAAASCGPNTTVAGSGSGPEVNPPGDIPDNQAFVAFSPPSNRYTVRVPEGWARTDGTDEVTFTDKFNTIHIALVPAAAAPTVASVQASELPQVAASARCYEAGAVTAVARKGGPAVRVTYRADAPPDAVTGKVVRDDVERYEFWSNGTAAVITLSGAAGSDNVDPWRTVTDSFRWT